MEKTIEANCGTCMAWTELPQQGTIEIGAKKRGLCRMFPPTPVPLYDQQGRVAQQAHLRPTPLENEFCFHYAARAADH